MLLDWIGEFDRKGISCPTAALAGGRLIQCSFLEPYRGYLRIEVVPRWQGRLEGHASREEIVRLSGRHQDPFRGTRHLDIFDSAELREVAAQGAGCSAA